MENIWELQRFYLGKVYGHTLNEIYERDIVAGSVLELTTLKSAKSNLDVPRKVESQEGPNFQMCKKQLRSPTNLRIHEPGKVLRQALMLT